MASGEEGKGLVSSKGKIIGTKTETAVVKAAHRNGFPDAVRNALAGANDRGDVTLNRNAIVEVKGGHMAENASQNDINRWMLETLKEAVNARAVVGILVTKKRGVGLSRAEEWDAWFNLNDLIGLHGNIRFQQYRDIIPVKMMLKEAFRVLRICV